MDIWFPDLEVVPQFLMGKLDCCEFRGSSLFDSILNHWLSLPCWRIPKRKTEVFPGRSIILLIPGYQESFPLHISQKPTFIQPRLLDNTILWVSKQSVSGFFRNYLLAIWRYVPCLLQSLSVIRTSGFL